MTTLQQRYDNLRHLAPAKLARLLPADSKGHKLTARAPFVPDAPARFPSWTCVAPGMRTLARASNLYPARCAEVSTYIAEFEKLNRHVPVKYELVNGAPVDVAIAA